MAISSFFVLCLCSAAVFAAMLPAASAACKFMCWKVRPGAYTFQACTAQDTLPIAYSDHTFVEEVHDGTACGTCAHDTDRRKGMFRDVPSSWCWIAFSDLMSPTPCTGEDIAIAHASLEVKNPYRDEEEAITLGCLAPGSYTPKTKATVRGKAGVTDPCHDQAQYLGTLVHGQEYHVTGCCDKAEWCSGNAGAPVSQEYTTVLCSDLEPM
jgi:hypothetical protein